MELKEIFSDSRIVGLCGEKNSGKTNNLISLIVETKKTNPNIPVYVYGFNQESVNYLSKLGVKEISSLKQMVFKRDCLLVIDEFQKLKLSDRRYKALLDEFVDFIYHNNVYCVLSSPNIREFNKQISSIIEKWLLKTTKMESCVNGSLLKGIIENYKGRYKILDTIVLNKSDVLVINQDYEKIITCKYIKEVDNKKSNKNIFV
jgi:hypothetical protein